MSLLCKIRLHIYQEKYSTGFTIYYECKNCGKRSYRQGQGGNQPIDTKWIEGAERKPCSKNMGEPPKGKSVLN